MLGGRLNRREPHLSLDNLFAQPGYGAAEVGQSLFEDGQQPLSGAHAVAQPGGRPGHARQRTGYHSQADGDQIV